MNVSYILIQISPTYGSKRPNDKKNAQLLQAMTWRLTHWGRVTHICVIEIIIIGSDNGLSPGRRQAIIWTNAGILLIRPLGTNFSEILGEIHTVSFNKMHLKMSSAKWRLFRLGLNVLKWDTLYPKPMITKPIAIYICQVPMC